jgi:hypothetical protein
LWSGGRDQRRMRRDPCLDKILKNLIGTVRGLLPLLRSEDIYMHGFDSKLKSDAPINRLIDLFVTWRRLGKIRHDSDDFISRATENAVSSPYRSPFYNYKRTNITIN